MKKSIAFLYILLCVTPSFAANVKLPQWFTEIPENEYVGISEPGGDENQAITMALLQYMFANHAKGVGSKEEDLTSGSWGVDGAMHELYYFKLHNTWSFTDTISYDVLETKELSTGEIVCRITAGPSQQTPISVSYQDYLDSSHEKNGEDEEKKEEYIIQTVIQSDLGDWVIEVYNRSSSAEDELHSWKSAFRTKDNTAMFSYQPEEYETQYVERQVTSTGEEAPCLGLSPYSICDNLLAGYKYLLLDVNSALAYDAIKHYYDGNIPIYSEKASNKQEIPIVLQTPITGITLYKKILDSNFPVLFYSKNKQYSPTDSMFVKNYIDQKVESYILPPFSDYAKNYIEPRINEWQKKGEFEKTSVWQERVSEPNRKKKIKEYLEEVKAEYLPQYAKRQRLEFTLGTYDPDHEVYLIKEATLGDLLVPVSLDKAPSFKASWEWCEFTPHYDIMGKEAGVSSIDFSFSDGEVFTYKADTALVYSSEEIQYNFSPLDIPLIGQSPIQNLATNLLNQSINKIVITTPFDLTPASSVLASYKNIFGKYEMPDKDVAFPYVVVRVTLTGNPNLIRIAKQSLALDLGQSHITEQTVPIEDKILFLVPTGVKNIYLTDGNGQRQLIYSGRLVPNTIYDGVIKVQ